MPISKIIRPIGKPVKRIQVDVDIQGQTQVTGNKRGLLGETQPMSMFEVCVLLANVVASTLLAMGGAIPLQTKTPAEVAASDNETQGSEGGEDGKAN